MASRGVLEDCRVRKPPTRLPRTPPNPRQRTRRSVSHTSSNGRSESEEDIPKKKQCRGKDLTECKTGTMASYSMKIQECLESAKDQFRLSLCTLGMMPSGLESYDRARDAIRAEAIRYNLPGMYYHYYYASSPRLFKLARLLQSLQASSLIII